MSVTIYDVAREANVSMATVSRVVNGNPNVKPTTRKKVLDTIFLRNRATTEVTVVEPVVKPTKKSVGKTN